MLQGFLRKRSKTLSKHRIVLHSGALKSSNKFKSHAFYEFPARLRAQTPTPEFCTNEHSSGVDCRVGVGSHRVLRSRARPGPSERAAASCGAGTAGKQPEQCELDMGKRSVSQPLLGARSPRTTKASPCRRRPRPMLQLVCGMPCGRWTAPMQTWRRALGSSCASRPPIKSRWCSPLSRRCGSLPPPSRGSPPQAATNCTRSISGASRTRRCSC